MRTYLRHLSPADRRAKAMIAAVAASGASIDYLEDAPRFRFVPVEPPLYDGKPSRRAAFTYPNRLNLRNFKPPALSADPQYNAPMAGDDRKLTYARAAWAGGNPAPLREYLAVRAA